MSHKKPMDVLEAGRMKQNDLWSYINDMGRERFAVVREVQENGYFIRIRGYFSDIPDIHRHTVDALQAGVRNQNQGFSYNSGELEIEKTGNNRELFRFSKSKYWSLAHFLKES